MKRKTLKPRKKLGFTLALAGLVGIVFATEFPYPPLQGTIILVLEPRRQILAGAVLTIVGGLLWSGFTWRWFRKEVRKSFSKKWLGLSLIGVGILVIAYQYVPIDFVQTFTTQAVGIAFWALGIQKGIIKVLQRMGKK